MTLPAKLLQMGAAGVSGAYQISRSLRFNSADSAYLTRTPASAGNRKTWTWSGWVKRSALDNNNIFFGSAPSGGDYALIGFVGNRLQLEDYNIGLAVNSSALYRDLSAWYHIVAVVDTTQATASNRAKIYVNGVQVTALNTASYPSQNADTVINSTNQHSISALYASYTTNYYFNGYLTEINFIDGQALTPSSFGQTNAQTGIWEPKRYGGTYGTNGFYLNFSDNSNTTAATLGKDSSGNGNNWTPTNFSVTAGSGNDSLVDSPTLYGTDTGAGGEVRGNYCTLNSLQFGSGLTMSNGNLTLAGTSSWRSAYSTIFMNSGKWYAEFTIGAIGANSYEILVGLAGLGTNVIESEISSGNTYAIQNGPGNMKINYNGGSTDLGSQSAYSANDVLMLAYDVDAGKLWFGKNGTWINSGAPASGTNPVASSISGTYCFAVALLTTSDTLHCNFGQRAFAYTAPSGFKALNTQNLPTPTIGATSTTQATDYFNTVLWTGNGSSSRAITGVGFAPDMVWYKSRSNAVSHRLFDKVRGANKELIPNLTDAEYTATDELLSFDSDGFTIGSETGTNANGYTYVGWSWRGNGAGSSNTAGSITSTVSANTTAGFSVVSWTCNNTANQSIGHGLGSVPKMIITKDRDQGTGFNWAVWFDGFSANEYLLLNTTGARASYSTLWYQTPDSTKFYIGSTGTGVNNATDRIIAYCFAPVAGFSAFSSYTGNGSTDGPFIYTGFRPAFLLIKASSGTSASGNGWQLSDDVREPYNDGNRTILRPNSSDAEVTDAFPIDFLSNGFKIRNSGTGSNESGTTYIYAAFAENPFKYSLAR